MRRISYGRGKLIAGIAVAVVVLSIALRAPGLIALAIFGALGTWGISSWSRSHNRRMREVAAERARQQWELAEMARPCIHCGQAKGEHLDAGGIEWCPRTGKPTCRECGKIARDHNIGPSGEYLCRTIKPSGRNEWPEPVGATRSRSKIPNDVFAAVAARDGGKCRECGSQENLELDHVIPWSLNGDDSVDNLQLLCRSCNARKGARV